MTEADATADGARRGRGLTRRGRAVLVSSVGLACTGRLLGLVELYVLAAGAAALVIAALTYVVTRRLDIEIERTLDPAHVHAGGVSRVRIGVVNRSTRPTPLVALVDRLEPGDASARLMLRPLGPRGAESADYRLPADERGLFRIGPLTGEVTDPFGLARRSVVLAGVSELTVYPRLDRVRPPGRRRGGQEDAESRHADIRSQSGGDFAGLRQYQIGDDMRRVHWPSTARTGDIMIRQHEVSRQGRVVVAVDIAGSAHSDDSFEDALSAAASVLAAAGATRCSVRLVTSDGYDSDYGAGAAHLHHTFGHLARLDRPRGAGTSGSVGPLAGPGRGWGGRSRDRKAATMDGAVVVLATSASDAEQVQRLAGLAAGPDAVTLVLFGVGDRPGGARREWGGIGQTLRLSPGDLFADHWDPAQRRDRH